MSNVGQGVLAVAGGVVGFLAGGPTGALYGFQIGLLAGTVAFPTQGPTVQRPRLSDVGTTSSNVGDPIAWGLGDFPCSGEIIWQSDLREVNQTTEEGGKGGPSSTVVTPTYFQDFAIGLDDAEDKVFGGVLRIWANGKVVYDRRPLQAGEASSDFNARMALSDSLDDIMTIYTGTEDQLPDPTMQMRLAAKSDIASAFRGLAYVVFANWQNKAEDGQRMPQTWKFECYTAGATDTTGNREYSTATLFDWAGGFPLDSRNVNTIASFTHAGGGAFVFDPTKTVDENVGALADILTWPGAEFVGAVFIGSTDPANGVMDTEGGPSLDQGGHTVDLYYAPATPDHIILHTDSNLPDVYGPGHDVLKGGTFNRILNIAGSLDFPVPAPPFDFFTVPHGGNATRDAWWYEFTDCIIVNATRSPSAPLDPAVMGVALNGLPGFVVDVETGGITKTGAWTFDGASDYKVLQDFVGVEPDAAPPLVTKYPLNPCLPLGDANDTEAFWTAAYTDAHARGKIVAGLVYGVDYPVQITGAYFRDNATATITTDPISIGDVVRAICKTAGYADADINTTQIDALTIIGYMRNTVMAGRGALDPLRSLGFFDIIESDGTIKCVKRGNATARVLSSDDLGAYMDGDTPPAARTSTKALDYSLPTQVRVHYLSPTRDLEADQQLSLPRINTDAVGISDIDLAAVITDDAAAQIADVLMNDAYQSRYSEITQLDQSQLELEPTDIIEIPIQNESTRCRIIDVTDKNQMLRALDLVRDDPGTYVSVAVGAKSVFVPQKPVIASPLGLILLDLPVLKDTDDDAGFYAATWPLLKAAANPGGALFRSVNGGDAYAKVASFAGAASVGTLLAALPAGPYDLFDYAHTVSVLMTFGTLSSMTVDEVQAGLNAAAIGADGRWEIIQFTTAAPGAIAGSYLLTGLTRGRRGTEHVIGSSKKGDAFVLLNGVGLARVVQNNSDIGGDRFYKAVGVGGAVEATAAVEFIGHGEALKPFSPVDLDGSRDADTGDWTLTWIRRGRVGVSMPSGADIPLSETTESYSVEILSGGEVVRTIAASTPSAVYLDADQITDLGAAQTTIIFRVYQLSEIVGRGYPSDDTTVIDTSAALPPGPGDFVPFNENQPVLLTGLGGKIIVAARGILGGTPVVGMLASDGATPAVCTTTTFDYAAGATPDSYFFQYQGAGKAPIPLVADAGDDVWVFYWRSQPLPSNDVPQRRFLYSIDSGVLTDTMAEQSPSDAILADANLIGMYRNDAAGKVLARNALGEIFSSSDGKTWVDVGPATGFVSGAMQTSAVIKYFKHGSAVCMVGDFGAGINTGADLVNWADMGAIAALNVLGYGSTQPTEYLDAASDGTNLVLLLQTHRDSDGSLVNMILRTTDSGATWASAYTQSFVLGDLANGQRWTDIMQLAGVEFVCYGRDAFTGFYPQVLVSVDSGASWANHQVALGVAAATAILCTPKADGAGNILAIGNASTRIIAPATTPTSYAGVMISADGITFSIVTEFEPT